MEVQNLHRQLDHGRVGSTKLVMQLLGEVAVAKVRRIHETPVELVHVLSCPDGASGDEEGTVRSQCFVDEA